MCVAPSRGAVALCCGRDAGIGGAGLCALEAFAEGCELWGAKLESAESGFRRAPVGGGGARRRGPEGGAR